MGKWNKKVQSKSAVKSHLVRLLGEKVILREESHWWNRTWFTPWTAQNVFQEKKQQKTRFLFLCVSVCVCACLELYLLVSFKPAQKVHVLSWF